MGAILIALLPFILGSALVPVQNIINIMLLKNPQQGLLKATAYVGGMTAVRLLQGLVFGLIFTNEASEGKSPTALTLQLVLGILLLVTAYKKWRKEEDPDAPPPKWMTMLDGLTPVKAFGFGMGILFISGKAWVFTLSAISAIAEKELGQSTSVLAYLLFVVLAVSLMLLAILFRVALPKQAKNVLEQVGDWLNRNNRLIVIVVSLVFGLYFLYQSIHGLLNL